jgi:redox-sensitive bicupin YhaK (pirin superfamily)
MRTRNIEQRHSGLEHGFIRRIISPEDFGQRLKPFVFLDFTHGTIPAGGGFGFHPHSGIATVTYQQAVDITYEDTTGQHGVVEARGIEWVQTGGCIWHRAGMKQRGDNALGFQLWLALPPELEEGPPHALYVPPGEVKESGNVRVLLGEYQGVRSQIVAPGAVNYFDVRLSPGEAWSYLPPPEHEAVWAFAYTGTVRVAGSASSEELLIFDREPGELRFEAEGPAGFMVGTARPHPHALVIGRNSVHTSAAALHASEQRIAELGAELRRQGRM